MAAKAAKKTATKAAKKTATKAAKKTAPRRLEIKPQDMRANLMGLFEDIRKNARLQESFIHNPTRYITQRVLKSDLPPQQLSEANRLLFSLIANDEMVKWLDNYEQGSPTKKIDKRQFAMDLARKIGELDDENILISVVSNAAQGYGIPGLTNNAYQCVCNETPNKYECACTPVAKDQRDWSRIDPDMVRSLTEHLISYAKQLSAEGTLADLGAQIR